MKSKNIYKYVAVFLLFTLTSVLSIHSLLLSEGNTVVYGDFFWNTNFDTFISKYFFSWDEIQGENSFQFLPYYFSRTILFSGLDFIGFSMKSITLLYFFSVIFIAQLTTFVFSRELTKDKSFLIGLVASQIIIFNPVFFSRLEHIGLLFGFAFIPLAQLFFLRFLRNSKIPDMIVYLLIFFLLSSHPYIFFMNALVSFILVIVEKKIPKSIFLAIPISFLLSAFIWMPFVFSSSDPSPSYALSQSVISILSPKESFSTFYFHRGFLNLISFPYKENLLLTFTGISLFIFAAWGLLRKNYQYLCFFSFLIAMLLLAHGNALPFLGDYYHLLLELPFLGWLFRSPTKFYLVAIFLLTMLASLQLSSLSTKVRTVVGSFIILLIAINGFFLIQSFSSSTTVVEYTELNSSSVDQATLKKITIANSQLFVPSQKPLFTKLREDPILFRSILSDVNSENLFQIKPVICTNFDFYSFDSNYFASYGFLPYYEEYCSNLLVNNFITSPEVIYPALKSKEHHPSQHWSFGTFDDRVHGEYHTYLDRFNISDYTYSSGGFLFTWKEEEFSENLELTDELIVNNLDFFSFHNLSIEKNDYETDIQILDESEKNWIIVRSSKINLTPGEHYHVYLKLKTEDANQVHEKFTFFNKSGGAKTKFLSLSVSGNNSLEISKALITPLDAVQGIVEIWFRNGNNSKYTIESVSLYKKKSTAQSTISVPLQINSEKHVYVEYYKNSQGGTIELELQNKTHHIESYSSSNQFEIAYLDRFNLKEEDTMEFSNIKGFNSIKAIYFLDKPLEIENKEIFLEKNLLYYNETSKKIQGIPSFKAQNVSFRKISPTKYLISIRNQPNPFFLQFSQPYDSKWKVYGGNGELISKSLPLYGVTNGFYIDQTGNFELTVEYEAQRGVYIGRFLSGVTVLLLLVFIIVLFLIKGFRKPKPEYQGHAYTEAMIDMHMKGKIDEKELREYLKRYYNHHEIKHIVNDVKKKDKNEKTHKKAH